jgi:hypothetical protein
MVHKDRAGSRKEKGVVMVGTDWKLTTSELDVLATDKLFMDKVSEIVDLTEEEMALISGSGGGFDCGCGYGYSHHHRRHHHHHHRHHRRHYW